MTCLGGALSLFRCHFQLSVSFAFIGICGCGLMYMWHVENVLGDLWQIGIYQCMHLSMKLLKICEEFLVSFGKKTRLAVS